MAYLLLINTCFFHFYILDLTLMPHFIGKHTFPQLKMLLSKEYIVKMPKKYRKILSIYAAYN